MWILWFVLAAFVGGWAGWAIAARKKGFSNVIAHGGGFLAGCLMMIVAFWVLGVYEEKPRLEEKPVIQSNPNSAPVAPLVWNHEKTLDEARQLLKVVSVAEKDLETAIETNDNPGFIKFVTRPLSEVIARWHQYPHDVRFDSCHDAAIQQHAYAMTMYEEYFSGRTSGFVAIRKERKVYSDLFVRAKAECVAAVRRN